MYSNENFEEWQKSLKASLRGPAGTFVPKLWGAEVCMVNTPQYCGKVLYLFPGRFSSLHRHNVKDETFLVLEGEVLFESQIDEPEMQVTQLLTKGMFVRVWPGTWHRFRALNAAAAVAEFSTHHDDADTYRQEPSGIVE